MKEPASSTWIPAAWSCCSGWQKGFYRLHRDRGCAECDHGAADGAGLPHLQRPSELCGFDFEWDPEEYLKNVAGSHGLED